MFRTPTHPGSTIRPIRPEAVIYRAVAQVDATGAIQVTPTNAYSGNNGRAAILWPTANTTWSATPTTEPRRQTNVVASTGVQISTPGQAANTMPQEIGNFSDQLR